MMGKLTGGMFKPLTEGQRSAKYHGKLPEREIQQLTAYSELCREIGEDESTVATAWVLHQPGITAPIIGPRTAEQLDASIRAVELTLSDDVLKRLDEIFPTCGAAPASYINDVNIATF